MQETDYRNFFYNLNNIQIQPRTFHKDQSQSHQFNKQKQKSKDYKFYQRHQILFQLKKIIIPKKSFDNTIADLIIEKYFTYQLNSIYTKITKMPKKFFVCGYCKQPFFRSSEYLTHCYIEHCPINHQRSTFFFTHKNSSILIRNEDLRQILKKDQLEKIMNVSYSHQRLLFSQYEKIFKNQSNSKSFLECQKCGYKISYLKLIKFISHCILSCPHIGKLQEKRQFKVIKNLQSIIEFKNDILNFHLNINLLTLFDKGYLKTQDIEGSYKKFQFYDSQQNKNSFNCDVFQKLLDKKQNQNNDFKLVTLPFYKSNQAFKGVIFPKFLKSQNLNKQILQTKLTSKLNLKYKNLSKYLLGTYFCGICLKFFYSIEQYIAHCLVYLCQLNYKKSSHRFYQEKSQKQLKIQNISINNLQNDIQKIIRDKRFANIQSIQLQRKYRPPVLHQRYICGVCSLKFQSKIYQKKNFINHVLKVCFSRDHQLTTHTFKIKLPQITDQEYEKIIMNYFYAMKIAQCSFGYKYVLSKNENVDFEGNYFCGSCETSFQSKEEFVYHSLTVCQSLESFESSHFIKKIYNPLASIEDPVSDLIQELKQASKYFKRSQENMSKIKTNVQQQKQKIQIQKDQLFENNQTMIEYESQYQKKIQFEDHQQIGQILQKQVYIFSKEQQDKFPTTPTKQILNQIQVTQNKQQQKLEFSKQQEQYREKIQQDTRFLRYNVDFLPTEENSKFYCAKCKLNFKKDAKFIQHLQQQSCRSYENLKSSHFYVTNNQMGKFFQNKVFSNRSDITKFTSFPPQFSRYQPSKSQKITCQCKQSFRVNKFTHHNTLKHGGQNLNSDNFIEIRQNLYGNWKMNSLVMISKNADIINYGHEFVCPCKPWKKLSYGAFVRHVIKRHEGKTPKFYMKLPVNR